jgi:hypothetical protein
MSNTLQTANLPAGIEAPLASIYVVSHYKPAHAVPHEVLIAVSMILPECNV